MCNVADLGTLASVVTVGGVIVTAWMAVETHRMASQTKRSVDLEYLPLLGIRDLKVGVSGAGPSAIDAITVGIELYNAGRVGLTYSMKSLRVTFADRTTDSASYLSRGGFVLPASSVTFWHPAIKLSPAVAEFPAKGRVRCEFEYKRDEKSEAKRLLATLEYVVAGPSVGAAMNWVFVDEPVAV